jgi:hypothetical protein
MKRSFLLGLALGLVCNGQNLTIRLYNLANAPAGTISRASAVAGQVLEQAGVAAIWEEGSPNSLEGWLTDMSACGTITAADTREYLVVSVVKGTSARAYPGALGYALPCGRQGAHARIFYDRTVKLALRLSVRLDIGTLLGAETAHEIGHVLLGSMEHSARGIMKAKWGSTEFQELACKDLRFASDEVPRMRAGASGRFGNRQQVSNPPHVYSSNHPRVLR